MNFQLTPLNRNLIIAAIIVVIGFVAYFSMYQPKHNELVSDQTRLAQLQQNYTDLKRVADQKPQYLALEQQIQTRLSGVELTADNRAYIPSYLKQIEDLAKRDGLTVTSVVPQPLPTPSGAPAAAAPANAAGTSAAENLPGVGHVLTSAANAAGGASMRAAQTNNTAAATGEAGPNGQTQNGTPAPSAGGTVAATSGSMTVPANGKPGPAATTTARQNAIIYVNQSFQQVPVNMELAGTFTQLQQFLRDLNKFPKLIGVGSVTLNPALQTPVGLTPTLHIVLPITAYRLTTGQPPASQPTAAPAAGNGG
jgi:Tfp pilus assembly protein PilO